MKMGASASRPAALVRLVQSRVSRCVEGITFRVGVRSDRERRRCETEVPKYAGGALQPDRHDTRACLGSEGRLPVRDRFALPLADVIAVKTALACVLKEGRCRGRNGTKGCAERAGGGD